MEKHVSIGERVGGVSSLAVFYQLQEHLGYSNWKKCVYPSYTSPGS